MRAWFIRIAALYGAGFVAGFGFGALGFGQPRGLIAVAGCLVGHVRSLIFPRKGGTIGGVFGIEHVFQVWTSEV